MQAVMTTRGIPAGQRAEYWEEMVTCQFVPARCKPNRDGIFSATIRSNLLGPATLSHVQSQGTAVQRTRQHIARSGEQYFLLSLQLRGTGFLTQAGRAVTLKPGDLALYDTARPYELNFAGGQTQLVFRVPRDELLMLCPGVEASVARHIPANQAASRAYRAAAARAASGDFESQVRGGREAAAGLIDLMLDAVPGQQPETRKPAADRRLAHAYRVAWKQLDDPEFSVARWALELGVSARYLRKLFGLAGHTPSQYLWQQRLDLAARRLRDVRMKRQSVTEIALACGFAESTHFSHAFRRRFGLSPSAYRQQARA